jgi:LDH2 family malate/lactate/ureidoglycolate dehydrogenase
MDDHSEFRYAPKDVSTFAEAILRTLRMPEEDAAEVVRALLDADMCRIRTHGLRLLPSYLGRLQAGALNPEPNITIEHRDRAISVIDGDDGFGQVVARYALDHGMELVETHGVAVVTVRHSNHLGALGYLTGLAASRGTFAFIGQNTRDNTVPAGGVRAGVGNNPFSLALPTGFGPPMVLDISCSIAAKNTLYRAAERDEPIPEGIAIDENGHPTTDAHAALRGAMLAFGGHKGAGLAMLIGALSAILPGANVGPGVPGPDDYSRERGLGHFILLMDTADLPAQPTYAARMRTYIDDIKRAGPDVRYPGERSAANREDAMRSGVLLPAYVISRLAEFAAGIDADVQLPEAIAAGS